MFHVAKKAILVFDCTVYWQLVEKKVVMMTSLVVWTLVIFTSIALRSQLESCTPEWKSSLTQFVKTLSSIPAFWLEVTPAID